MIYYNVYNKNGTRLIRRWKHQILQKSWRLISEATLRHISVAHHLQQYNNYTTN